MPPRWILEPTDKAFAQGSDAKVECKADGFPKPQVTWKRAEGKITSFTSFPLMGTGTETLRVYTITILWNQWGERIIVSLNKAPFVHSQRIYRKPYPTSILQQLLYIRDPYL